MVSGASTSQSPAQTAGTGPAGTGGPAGPAARPPALPLPLASMTDAGEIGSAMYDPSRVDDAVVSLLQLLGIGVYRPDGTPVRTGDEADADDPWLLEDEVWGLIEAAEEDLLNAGDSEPRYRLGDLYDQLQRLLPAGFSRAQFIDAYSTSYAGAPDDLAPRFLLGQPLDSSTPLTRTQLWLLYLDGFVDLATPSTAGVQPGAQLAVVPNRPRFSTASQILPPILHEQTLTNAQWAFFRTHMLTIGYAIWFTLDPPETHEGHGGPGQTYQIPVEVGRGQPIVSPTTGEVLLAPNPDPLDGLAVRFESDDRRVLDKHGSLTASLPYQVLTDSSGRASIGYATRREASDGVGVETSEWASLTAWADVVDLIRRAYLIDDESIDWLLSTGFINQDRAATGPGFPIAWHAPGLEIEIRNDYDVTIDVFPAGMQATAWRNGFDSFTGTLVFDEDDQTYRGSMHGITDFTSKMSFTLPLAAGTCGDQQDGDLVRTDQSLYVVARQEPALVTPAASPMPSPFEGSDLVLSFYPAFRPIGNLGSCAETVPYFGPAPPGQSIYRRFAPYLDARFTTPENGYRIHVPAEGTLTYWDWEQWVPSVNVKSVFKVTVTWVNE